MTDIHPWDFSEEFTGEQAACLMTGLDPYSKDMDMGKIKPIILRLKKSYYASTRDLTNDLLRGEVVEVQIKSKPVEVEIDSLKNRVPEKNHIWSIEIENLVEQYNISYKNKNIPDDLDFSKDQIEKLQEDEIEDRLKKWDDKQNIEIQEHWKRIVRGLKAKLLPWAREYVHEFDDQKFSRRELNRWLSENNLSSRYNFLNSSVKEKSSKPLTTHEKNTLLVLIGALCHQCKVELDRNAASKVQRMVEAIGISMSAETIRDKLSDINDAIEARLGDSSIKSRSS